MNKPMTAAEYAAHAESVKAKRPTETVSLKSGSVFELRRIDLKGMVQLGIIPHSLVDEGMKAWERHETNVSTPTAKAAIESLILQREVVAACCVMPPFNEFTAKSFLPEDFEEIFLWALSHQGVENAQGVSNFRKGRKRRTSGNRANSKELQPTSESTATN